VAPPPPACGASTTRRQSKIDKDTYHQQITTQEFSRSHLS
jgi:hypothetical protein